MDLCKSPGGSLFKISRHIGLSGVPTNTKRITILGSTGSIGKNTLDLVARTPSMFAVEAITANQDVNTLAQQAQKFKQCLVYSRFFFLPWSESLQLEGVFSSIYFEI